MKREKENRFIGIPLVIGALAMVLIVALDRLEQARGEQLQRFFLLLSRNPLLAAALLALAIFAVFALCALIAKKTQARGAARRDAQHSHDRVRGYAGKENEYEHWKKQLDVFLEAGLIDRREYQALLERRKTDYLG